MKNAMKNDHWIQSALTNNVLVAELLLRLKHSSDSDSNSSRRTKAMAVTSFLPPRWGNRKNRSKSTASTTNGCGKEHRGSPTTHLSWSGGAGSSSDGYEESSRPSDLSSGSRSLKANEGASICSYNKSQKRKELATLRVNLNQQMGKSEKLTRRKMRRTGENEGQMALSSVKAEEGRQRGFVLPDLNMAPDEEDLSMMI